MARTPHIQGADATRLLVTVELIVVLRELLTSRRRVGDVSDQLITRQERGIM